MQIVRVMSTPLVMLGLLLLVVVVLLPVWRRILAVVPPAAAPDAKGPVVRLGCYWLAV